MDNTNYSQILKESTNGKVRLLTYKEYKQMPSAMKKFYASDFARLCGCITQNINQKDNQSSFLMLQDTFSDSDSDSGVVKVGSNYLNLLKENEVFSGIAPVVEIDIARGINLFQKDKNNNQNLELKKQVLSSIKLENVDGETLHYLNMGTYPQTFVGRTLNDELENLFSNKSTELTPTGRTYISNSNVRNSDSVFTKAFHPEFEYNGERYVRIINRNDRTFVFDGGRIARIQFFSPAWVKVEPIKFYVYNWDRLPKSINPNGNGRDRIVKLVSANVMTSSIPYLFDYTGTWVVSEKEDVFNNSVINGFLNGKSSDTETYNPISKDNQFSFEQTGGFLSEAFELDKSFSKTLVIDKAQVKVRDYDISGCLYFDNIILKNEAGCGKYAFYDTNMKYMYLKNRNVYVSASRPILSDEKEQAEVVDLKNFFTSFREYRDCNLVKYLMIPFIGEILKKLAKNKVSFPFNFFDDMRYSQIEDFAKNSNLRFFSEMLKELEKMEDSYVANNSTSSTFYRFFNALGCFSNEYVLDKEGKKTKTLLAQKACVFVPKLLANDKANLDFIEENIPEYFYPKPNQNFLNFISVKNSDGKFENFDLIREIGKSSENVLEQLIKNFDGVKKYRKGINEKGTPFTRPWKTAICMFLIGGGYFGVNEDNKDIADTFTSFGLNQAIFDEAIRLRHDAILNKTPHHILGKPLKEETILDSIQRLKAETGKELEISPDIIADKYSKMFTYEFLDKYDPANFIIGLYADCCCTISGQYYGGRIAKKSITSSKLQNMVIRNAKNEIVGKATMYVGNGKAVFNEFDIAEEYRTNSEVKQKALNAFLRGTSKFIKNYNEQHPEDPLRVFNVGMGFNKLKDILGDLEVAQEKDIVEVPSQFYFEDADEEQRILYKEEDDINPECYIIDWLSNWYMKV